jgi:hypothetical protein
MVGMNSNRLRVEACENRSGSNGISFAMEYSSRMAGWKRHSEGIVIGNHSKCGRRMGWEVGSPFSHRSLY